jgi:hypothetical protein
MTRWVASQFLFIGPPSLSALIVDATRGSYRAAQVLFDRGRGRAPQTIAINYWRKEAEAAGIDADELREELVEVIMAKMQHQEEDEDDENTDDEG